MLKIADAYCTNTACSMRKTKSCPNLEYLFSCRRDKTIFLGGSGVHHRFFLLMDGLA